MPTPIDPTLLALLIDTIAAAWPGDIAPDIRHTAARNALEALQPADFMEALFAARMIGAQMASMDGLRRAGLPGVSDADAVRLRASAIAAGRSADAAQRVLAKSRTPAAPARAPRLAAAASADPANAYPEEQALLAGHTPEALAQAEYALDNDPAELARNELEQRIPLYRWEDMTMEERRIANAPRTQMTPAMLAVLGARIARANRGAAENPQRLPAAAGQLSSSLSQ